MGQTGSESAALLRLMGTLGFCVGVAWLVQVLGFPPRDGVAGEFAWVIGAALISGASVGLIFVGRQSAQESQARWVPAVRRLPNPGS